jgi:hypothetical protein
VPDSDQKRLVEELEADLARWETQSLEFMEGFQDTTELAKEIGAFATTNAGRIYIGVDDDGKVVGIAEIASLEDKKSRDEYLKRIQGITQGIDPPVRVEVDFVEKDARIVVRIDVPKGSRRVYYVKGRPYLRDLTASRVARSSEVEELYSKSFAASPPVRRVDETQSYIYALLNVGSDIELVLSSYRDNLINPDQSQMLYDIHVYAEIIFGLSQVKPAKDLKIEQGLVGLSHCLDELAAYRFTMGTQSVDAFGDRTKRCLSLLTEVKSILYANAKMGPLDAYARRLRQSLVSLQNTWKGRERRFEIGDVELLKEAFRQHAFAIYRLAGHPEATRLGVADELSKLGRNLRELQSTEKYFAHWHGDQMIRRIEEKFSQCEPLIERVMQKIPAVE